MKERVQAAVTHTAAAQPTPSNPIIISRFEMIGLATTAMNSKYSHAATQPHSHTAAWLFS